MGRVHFSGLRCERCSHKWLPRLKAKPLVCPKCKSPYWDRKRAKPTLSKVAAKRRRSGAGGSP
jgi:hypothetical protein